MDNQFSTLGPATLPMKESKKDFRGHIFKASEVRIQALDHGYIVNVGCKSFAFEEGVDSISIMLKKIKAYLENPEKVEQEYGETGKF